MIIKQDPVTGLYCRSDGAILMPPAGRFTIFRWTFGSDDGCGYKQVMFQRKYYRAHRIICRAFHGLPPKDKPYVDHINRVRSANFASNLRWVDHKENADNADSVDRSIEKYKVRACEDKKAYDRIYYETHREEIKARSRWAWALKRSKDDGN